MLSRKVSLSILQVSRSASVDTHLFPRELLILTPSRVHRRVASSSPLTHIASALRAHAERT